MAVWKKQADGSWKITAESFSSDVPAVAAAPKKAEPRHTTKRKASKKRRRTA
jgi:hypothetical protein